MSANSLDILHIRPDLIAKIHAAAQSRKPRAPELHKKPAHSHRTSYPDLPHTAPAVIAVGASTGGPKALQDILPLLPGELSASILIVQHMPPGFTAPFAQRLNSLCSLEVREATDDEPILPGVAYIAPAGTQMTVGRPGSNAFIMLEDGAPNQLHTPSVNVMMKSVAKHFGNLAMGVILTGMGTDGAEGMDAIRKQGGFTIGQDEASCTVYGMPRACAELGALARTVPLLQIPAEILEATRYRKRA
jgi:two-component system, chemotaxis family, protein-glutamate methylesterase/glutaminase